MDTLEIIREQEISNEGVIYLYCVGNSWRAFGRSAFYLSLLYPELEVVREDTQNITRFFVCIPDYYLIKVFDINQIYVDNEYIEIRIPERICNGNDEYIQWCNKLLTTQVMSE
ncbi:hypothetical protein [uncultured Bacteroides sp.]|uniref:hypothetical protein n=1 Tax=uncultured Bacteroides sp. TaxID=162156 RepID=UPI0025E21FFC|nr:hypothetical protein [uncultured Bacteroides sp.]